MLTAAAGIVFVAAVTLLSALAVPAGILRLLSLLGFVLRLGILLRSCFELRASFLPFRVFRVHLSMRRGVDGGGGARGQASPRKALKPATPRHRAHHALPYGTDRAASSSPPTPSRCLT